MDIVAAIKREEKRLEKQLGKLQHQLNGVRAAAKALGDSASQDFTQSKDFKSYQEAVGEVSGAGEEGSGIGCF